MALRPRASLVTPLLVLALAACGGTAVGGGSGSGGAGGSGVGGAGGQMSATTASSSTGAGGAPNAIVYGDSTVTFRVSNVPLDCSAPTESPPFSECSWFNVEISMPAANVQVGTIDLGADGSVSVYTQEATAPYSSTPGDCGGTAAVTGGGMGAMFGLLDITDVSAANVTFTLSQTSFFLDQDANGTYTAPRCQ